MSDAPEALDGLSELAACDLRLARRFAARIEALPQDADDKAMALARSYQRMARSYRQSIALQARLRRELKAEARDDARHADHERRRQVSDHQAAIKARVRSLIWDEHEEERAEQVDELLYDLVADAAERPDFLEHPVDAHVAAFAAVLGLNAPEVSPSGGKRRDAPQEQVADGGGDPADRSPIGHSLSASGRFPPQAGETEAPWADEDSS